MASSLPLVVSLNCLEDTSFEVEALAGVASVEHVGLSHLADGRIESAVAVLLHSLAFLPRAAQRRLQPWQLILCLGSSDRAVDSALATDLGLRLVHVDVNRAEEIADTIMALFLALLRRTNLLSQYSSSSSAASGWFGSIQPLCRGMRRCRGLVLGIIGRSASARCLAIRSLAFRMSVLYFDVNENNYAKGKGKFQQSSITFPPAARKMDTLNDLLAASDLVSLHCALSDEPIQILDAECLQHTKPGSFIVNTSNSQLIDDYALKQLLIDGIIAGCALDGAEGPQWMEAWQMEALPTDLTPSSRGKRKNFLWSANPEWISGLLQMMCEYVDANMRSSQGFKDTVYKGVSLKLKEKFKIDVTPEQCKNQIRHQRSLWSHIQELKRKSGVSWDDNRKMILMGYEEYIAHIQAFPKDACFLNIPIANYIELEKVCGEGHATGEWAKSGNSQTSFGTPPVSLEDDDLPNFMEADINISQTSNSVDAQHTDNTVDTMKRTIPSSSKECVKRKKRKRDGDELSMSEYVVMMADSVAQIANAIQSTTKAPEDKEMNLFTELMTQLSSIPGFSAIEVDTIYDKLAKNLTMIKAFLAKPLESKARWMRMELEK